MPACPQSRELCFLGTILRSGSSSRWSWRVQRWQDVRSGPDAVEPIWTRVLQRQLVSQEVLRRISGGRDRFGRDRAHPGPARSPGYHHEQKSASQLARFECADVALDPTFSSGVGRTVRGETVLVRMDEERGDVADRETLLRLEHAMPSSSARLPSRLHRREGGSNDHRGTARVDAFRHVVATCRQECVRGAGTCRLSAAASP